MLKKNKRQKVGQSWLIVVRLPVQMFNCIQLMIVLPSAQKQNGRERFAAWRSGGFLAQKFNRRTALEPTTKLSYEALNPPLRQAAVSGRHSSRLVTSHLIFHCQITIPFS
jgi:hypothetical protein